MTKELWDKINTHSYTIKTNITIEEYFTFIARVYNEVIDEDTGTYFPELRNIVLKEQYIRFLTDLNYDDFEMNTDDFKTIDIVVESVKNKLYWVKEVENAIDAKINFALQKMANKSNASDELILRFAGFLDKGSKLLETLTNMASSMSPEELKGALANLKDIDLSKFTSKDIIDAVFAKHAKKPRKGKSDSIKS